MCPTTRSGRSEKYNVDGDTSCSVSVVWSLVTVRAICTNISSRRTVSSVFVVGVWVIVCLFPYRDTLWWAWSPTGIKIHCCLTRESANHPGRVIPQSVASGQVTETSEFLRGAAGFVIVPDFGT